MIVYSHFIEEKPVARNGRPSQKLSVRTMVDERGREVLDSTPVQIPVNFPKAAPSLIDLMHQLYASMKDEGVETFEDAENFDIPDETGIEMMDTPYEQDFDHSESAPVPAGAPQESPAVVDQPTPAVPEVTPPAAPPAS